LPVRQARQRPHAKASVNRPLASLMPETVSNPTWSGPLTRPIVTTSVIAAPASRIVVGGGADPSGVTRRPDRRRAGTGRIEIATGTPLIEGKKGKAA